MWFLVLAVLFFIVSLVVILVRRDRRRPGINPPGDFYNGDPMIHAARGPVGSVENSFNSQ